MWEYDRALTPAKKDKKDKKKLKLSTPPGNAAEARRYRGDIKSIADVYMTYNDIAYVKTLVSQLGGIGPTQAGEGGAGRRLSAQRSATSEPI